MKVYIVEGSAGSYSDYRNWPVCAYLEQAEAELHSKLANEWIEQNLIRYKTGKKDIYMEVMDIIKLNPAAKYYEVEIECFRKKGLINPYDKVNGTSRQDDTGYNVIEVELKDKFDVEEEIKNQ